MADIYDTILDRQEDQLASPVQESGSIYDSILDQQAQTENDKMLSTLSSAAKVNPDIAAEAQRISKETSIPPDVAQRNIDEARQRARMMQIQQMQLMKKSPILALQLQNPEFAKIAHDEIDGLSNTERTITGTAQDIGVTFLKGAVGLPQAIVGLADIPTGGQVGKTLEEMGFKFAETQRLLNELYSPAQKEAQRRVDEAEGFFPTAKALVQNPSVIATTVGESLPQMLGGAGIARGLIAKFPSMAGWLAAAIGEGAISAGSQAEQIRSETEDGLLTPKQSAAAVATGVGTSIFGAAGGKLAQKFGVADLDTLIANGGVDGFMAGQIKQGFFKSIAKAGVSEGLFEELPQSFQEQIWQNWALDKPLLENVGEAAATGFVAGTATGGAAGAFQVTVTKYIAKETEAEKQNTFIQTLTNDAVNSKVRERNPEAYEAYIQSLSKGTPVENIYIDADRFADVLRQSNITPEQVEQAIPGITSQIQNIDAGGDIIIPTSQYAARIAGTDLGAAMEQHVRISPDFLSAAEAQEAATQRDRILKEAATIIEEQRATNDEFVRAARDVETQIYNQIKGTKTYTDKVARNYAEFVRDFVVTQSAAMKVTPTEFYNRYMYRVEAGQDIARAEMFDQAGNVRTESPEFQAFYGNSVFRDQQGAPKVLYHGTTADITEFDLDHPDRKDSGWLGTGVYLTDSPAAAKMYADQKARKMGPAGQNVMTLFARVENPYYATPEEKARIRAGGREAADAFTKQLQDQGYDGVILPIAPDANEIVVFNPADVKSTFNSGTWSRETTNILAQREIAIPGQSTGEGNKHGLMPYLRVKADVQIPAGKKPLFAQTTMNSTAPRQIAAIDEVLARHPNATDSVEAWNAMMADALASDDIPVPPYAFIKNLNGTGSVDLLKTLSPGQIKDADHGFENAAGFRDDYINGRISIEDTGRLFLWSFLSRGVSPYTQESLFIDSFSGIGEWIAAAANGTLESRIDEYRAWASTAAPKGSGQPGAGATHNLNAFGETFLVKMSQDAGDGTGRSRLQVLHDMMSDPNSTGKQVRRKFLEMGEGVGIDNKVVSFTLLIAGYNDVMVLDRVQIRELWNDGRFDGINLYDGFKEDKKVVAGSALSNLTYGARGLLIYEAIERGLETKIQDIYTAIGRPEAASIGRYHWETWVASSNQEASHATIDAILAAARGSNAPLEGVTAKEGEYGAYAYGARYGRTGEGVPYFLYSVPGKADYRFTVEQFREFLDGIQVKKNGIIPSKFKVTESGNQPWYMRSEVNLDKLAELAGKIGERYEPDTISAKNAAAGVDQPITNRLAAGKPGPGGVLRQSPIDSGTAEPGAEFAAGSPEDLAARSRAEAAQRAGQFAKGARGGFDPKRLTTILNEKADYSTFLHETAHFFLTVYADMAASPNATAQMQDDMQTLLNWFGVKDLATWNAMSLDEQRKYHEAFAYNYEIYLFEGKAPSVKLQGLFDRFSAWLKRLYVSIRDDLNRLYRQENGEDLPILTGEVRQVMDRMIASEEQINQALQIRNMMGLFQTQEQSGMDDATWAAYQDMLKEANDAAMTDMTKASLRQMKWLSNARSRVIKELQKTADTQRNAVRAEVAEEVKNSPVYRAIEFLKRGTIEGVPVEYPTKLSIPEIEVMYGDNPIVGTIKKTLGFGKYGMLGTENGIHPDQAAEMFGFPSGDALVRALLDARPMKDEIDARTDKRMLEEYGDLTDPKQMEDAVEAALHNEARARFVAVELRFLAKATAPVRVMTAAAKQVANQILANKKLSEIKPRDYSMAEARAAKQAEAAMKKGESVAAQKAKQNQLVQNQLATQASEAKVEVMKAMEGFKKLFKADDRLAKTRNMDLVDTARAILTYYGIGGKKGKSPVEYIEKLRAYNPQMYAEIEPLIMDAATGSKQFLDLTLDEFRSLRDTIEALWYQSKRENEIMIEGKLIEKKEAVGALVERIEEIGVPEVVPGERMAPSTRDKIMRSLNTAKALTRRVEHWADATDGAKGPGPFTTYIWRPIRQALDNYRAERNKYVKRFVELLEGVSLPVGKIEATELNYTFGNENGGIGKAELLGAMLHTGNESNLKKLLLGRGWGELNADGTLDTSRWRAFEQRMINEGRLTKADYDWLQSVWDLNEEIKPMAQKAHHDIFGYYFKEVGASPVNTPFGTYRGGYVPAKTDQFLVRDAQKNAKMEELESDFRNSMPSTGMGFTKGRVEYNKPLSLDVRLMAKHIDDVVRFAMVQPAVKDVLGLVRSREFGDKLSRLDPTAIEEMILPWLNRAARQITSEAGMHKGVDRFWSAVRSRTGVSIMFANLTNAMQQMTGYFPAATKAKAGYLKKALFSYVSDTQATTERVSELSKFMADRLQAQMFDVQENMNDLLLNPSKYEKVQKWAQHHGYFLQTAFQNQVDVVTWTAVYNQTIAELGADMTDEKANREAVQRADAAVRMTQGSLLPEDISSFEVGSPFYKTLIQFAGYFNMLANLNANEYIKIFRDMGWRGNKGKIFMQYLLGFALPMIIADAIVRTLGGQWDDDDDDGYLDEVMEWFFGSQIKGAVALVPFGTAAAVPFNAFNNKPYDDRMTTSPSVSTLEAATVGTVKAGINIVDPNKEVTGKNVRDVLTLISLVTGIPLTVLGRPIGYAVDVERDKIQPTGPVDVTRGLVTGKASEASQP